MKIDKNIEVLVSSADGGVNVEITKQPVEIYYSPTFEQVVVEHLSATEGCLSVAEVESLLEDMKYLENKVGL